MGMQKALGYSLFELGYAKFHCLGYALYQYWSSDSYRKHRFDTVVSDLFCLAERENFPIRQFFRD